MRTSLQGIARKAKENKRHRFRDLYRVLNEEGLLGELETAEQSGCRRGGSSHRAGV